MAFEDGTRVHLPSPDTAALLVYERVRDEAGAPSGVAAAAGSEGGETAAPSGNTSSGSGARPVATATGSNESGTPSGDKQGVAAAAGSDASESRGNGGHAEVGSGPRQTSQARELLRDDVGMLAADNPHDGRSHEQAPFEYDDVDMDMSGEVEAPESGSDGGKATPPLTSQRGHRKRAGRQRNDRGASASRCEPPLARHRARARVKTHGWSRRCEFCHRLYPQG